MRLSRQLQTCFLFFTKLFHAHENTHKQTLTNKKKNQQSLKNKGNNFLRTQTSKRVKIACLAFWCFLCARNLFVKNKKQA